MFVLQTRKLVSKYFQVSYTIQKHKNTVKSNFYSY